MIIKNLLLVITLFLLLTGCRNNPVQSDRIKDDFSGSDNMEVVKEIYYRFPAPDEMLSFIDKKELVFTDEFLHPVEKSTSYLDSRSQALNLGIYTADMAYITLFQRQKEALTYFQVIYGLSDQLRVSGAFDLSMMKRFERNLKEPDSLKVIADEAMSDIIDYLVSNDKERVFAVISIGGFIEGLYIAFNVAGEYSDDNPIIQHISDQKLVLDNLLGYCKEFEDDQNINIAIHLLDPVAAIYNQLNISSTETTITEIEEGKLLVEGGDQITITEEQYTKLQETVYAARIKITENLVN